MQGTCLSEAAPRHAQPQTAWPTIQLLLPPGSSAFLALPESPDREPISELAAASHTTLIVVSHVNAYTWPSPRAPLSWRPNRIHATPAPRTPP